ncbi:MAG: glycosyltransferase family 4 protein [Ignavibacteria bacterium]|nr:glycosyltransferase family 4 protein [Ignavibacteria bacterium]
MRIGIVLPEVPGYSETFFNSKIKGLQESGHYIIVFSNKKARNKFSYEVKSSYPVFEKKSFKQSGLFAVVLIKTFIKNPAITVNLIRLESKTGKSFSESLKSVYINSHILSGKLDRIHFGFTTMILKRENVAKAIGAKMSISFRGYDINVFPLKNKDCYKNLWRKVDKVHTISDYLYRKALSLGLPKEVEFQKITPAIDISSFKVKDEIGKINKKIKILTVGRLNWIKDYETSISAMKILNERGIDFTYNIIGEGAELERLTFAVYQSGLQDKVNFLGKKEHKEINEYMRESDIYLQPSMQEGFCVSVLEAQATGLQCIVSDAEGLKENVIDGVTGWVVKRRSPEKFAEKITEVINLPDHKRKETAMNARKRVETEFTIEGQKKKFNKFFTE